MYPRKGNYYRQDYTFSSYTAKPSMIPLWGRKLTPRKAIYALISLVVLTILVYVSVYSYSNSSILTVDSKSKSKGQRTLRKSHDSKRDIIPPTPLSFHETGINVVNDHHADKDTEGDTVRGRIDAHADPDNTDKNPPERQEEDQEFFDYAGDFIARAEEKDFPPDGHKRYQKVKSVIRRLRNKELFSPAFNRKEKLIFIDLLETFDEIARRHRIIYFIYGGTLLGSYRHHDIIPWDDDVDVIIPVKQRSLLVDALKNLAPKYRISTSSSEHYKFYNHKSDVSNLYFDWGWPYLDISFYGENETHIWDIADTYGQTYEYNKYFIFPLHLRPLGKLWLPSPRDTYAYLYYTYGASETCAMNHYIHKIEMVVWCKGLTKKCHKLRHKYPFVYREEAKKGVRETLKFNGTTLHSFIVPEPEYAVTEPYGLYLDDRVYKKHFNTG